MMQTQCESEGHRVIVPRRLIPIAHLFFFVLFSKFAVNGTQKPSRDFRSIPCRALSHGTVCQHSRCCVHATKRCTAHRVVVI